jgi:transposase
MYLRYDDLIAETPDELARLERQHRRSPVADRFKMLRLLKAGAARSRRALAETLGYSERQLHRWFDTYRTGGVEALARYEPATGSSERITPEALAALETEMKVGDIASLKEAQHFLEERFAITYTVGGLSDLFQRKRIKLKTGRRRHVKASAEEQEAWKKTVPD